MKLVINRIKCFFNKRPAWCAPVTISMKMSTLVCSFSLGMLKSGFWGFREKIHYGVCPVS